MGRRIRRPDAFMGIRKGKLMHVTSIIAEYNPLHCGHLYHMQETRRITGADYMITVLSGDFMQRGQPAILDKHTRAKWALEAGSDLVLELPVPYALSSAEGFAFGGVSLLEQLHCVDTISFGSEAGTISDLRPTAQLLQEISLPDTEAYQSALKKGLTPPMARIEALKILAPDLDLTALSAGSNNLLALEYLRALSALHSPIQPVTVKRAGADYLDTSMPSDRFASAASIRRRIETASDFPVGQLSDYVLDTLIDASLEHRLLFQDDFSALLKYQLLFESRESLTEYGEVSSSLANRMLNQLFDFTTASEYANALWTKDITYARVCRALSHMMLRIKKDTWDVHSPVPYARVLGFKKEASPLLSSIKKNSGIPLITKLADAYKLLSPEAYRLLELDMRCAHIYDSIVQQKSGIWPKHEMQKELALYP